MDTLTRDLIAGIVDPDLGPEVVLAVAANDSPILSALIAQGLTGMRAPSFKIASDTITTPRTLINGAAFDETSTALVVDSTAGFVPGQLVLFEATGEVAHVSTVTEPSVLTVIRGVGTAAAAASVADNAAVRVIGGAAGEGAAPPTADMVAPTDVDQYCMTNRTAVKYTGRAGRTPTKTTDERARQRLKKLRQHTRETEAAIKFSSRAKFTDANGDTVWATDGLYNVISRQIAVGGALTDDLLISVSEQAFEQGGPSRLGFAGPTALSAINKLGQDKLNTRTSDRAVGLQIVDWVTAHGVVTLVRDNSLVGANAGDIILIDPENVELGYTEVDAKGYGGLPHIIDDVKKDGVDGTVDEVVSEVGIDYMNEQAHTIVTGITGAA